MMSTATALMEPARSSGSGGPVEVLTEPRLNAAIQPMIDRAVRLLVRFPTPVIVLVHTGLFAGIFLMAYLLRFDGAVPRRDWEVAATFLPVLIALKLGAFIAMGSHRGWCRYNTFADMVGVARAATFGTLAIILAAMIVRDRLPVPRSVLAIDWAGTILVVGGLRGAIRLFRERWYPWFARLPARPVLIVGASDSGVALAREIRSQPGLGMRVVGFLDPDPTLSGQRAAGIRVLGPVADVGRHARRLGVRTVLAPTPALPPGAVRELVTTCGEVNVEVQVVPGFDALLSGRLVVQPRDVDIHDLLYREPIQLDDRLVGRFLRGRTVLVTGAAGSIGSELCRQLLSFNPSRLILLDHSENGLFFIERELRERVGGGVEILPRVASITNASRLRALFAELAPEVVFHAAAHKHVPMMEANPGEAVRNNVFGTRTLVDEAIRAGVESFVMISTDKAVHPTSVMGACKRAAEMYVQALSEFDRVSSRLITVRFGNVLGSNGSVVPLFKEQIRRGGPVTVTHPEMTRYFMTIPEATQLVLQAGALGAGGEIFVLDMGQPVRVMDLARDLIRLSGMREGRDIAITFTGLRPGEKLYEELYDAGEQRLPTPHPKIFSARHRPCALEHVEAKLEKLARVLDGPDALVVTALRDLVPEFRPGGLKASPVRKPGDDSRSRRDPHRPAESVLITEDGSPGESGC